MSNLLKEKCTLAKLRAELEGRQEKLYYGCKKFGHLACNCRNRREGEKKMLIPQNRFKMLSSRVMRCEVEIRRQKRDKKEEGKAISCFKCKEEEHQWKECPERRKERRERVVRVAVPQKVQLQKEPTCSIRRNAQENEIRCFECEGVGHQCRNCPNKRLAREKAARVVNPQKVQQKERRSSENTLRQRAFEHCGKKVPEEADLFELEWSNGEVIVSYLMCEDCGKKGHYVAEDRGQGVVKGKEWEELKKYRGCAEKGKGKAARSAEGKAQQSGAWARDLEGTAKERGKKVRKTFKMLKEV